MEDDEQILDLVQIMLEEKGYEVLATSSPAEAYGICGGAVATSICCSRMW